MPPVFGLTLLVLICAVGLTHLAVHRAGVEHRVAAGVVMAIGFSLLVSAPAAGLLLIGACAVTHRVARGDAAVPDRLPNHWA